MYVCRDYRYFVSGYHLKPLCVVCCMHLARGYIKMNIGHNANILQSKANIKLRSNVFNTLIQIEMNSLEISRKRTEENIKTHTNTHTLLNFCESPSNAFEYQKSNFSDSLFPLRLFAFMLAFAFIYCCSTCGDVMVWWWLVADSGRAIICNHFLGSLIARKKLHDEKHEVLLQSLSAACDYLTSVIREQWNTFSLLSPLYFYVGVYVLVMSSGEYSGIRWRK